MALAQVVFLLILAGGLYLFVSERLRVDVTAMLSLRSPSFLTPIGHHGNLLILGPGQYRFGDFLRVGLPLTALITVVSGWMARWLWLGGPLLPVFGS